MLRSNRLCLKTKSVLAHLSQKSMGKQREINEKAKSSLSFSRYLLVSLLVLRINNQLELVKAKSYIL